MPKKCIEPNCTNNQFGGGYCLYHQYRRKSGTKTKCKGKTIRKKTKVVKNAYFGFKTQIEMFDCIWEKQPHVCWLTGRPLQYKKGDDKWVNQMAHVLRKGTYTYFKLNPNNIRLLLPEIHDLVDNFKEEYREIYYWVDFDKWFRLQDEMRIEYEVFKSKNLLA